MRKVLLLIALVISITSAAQISYKYYFFGIRPTGKMEVEIAGQYPETDSLLIESFNVNKKGDTTFVFKKFGSYSEVFNVLSSVGLEYVEFRNLPLVGGATRMLVGGLTQDFVIWRKKIE